MWDRQMFGFNINFGGVDGQFEIFDCVIDIEANGNKQRNRMQAPRIIIEQQFLGVCQEIAQMNTPATVRLSRIAKCYNNWTGDIVEREVYILFENDAWCNEHQNK